MKKNDEKLDMMRHSAAHVLAAAVAELWPEAKFGVGPIIENGFYYDILTKAPIKEDDLVKIESKMEEIIKRDDKFLREEMPIGEAIKLFEKMGQVFKVELLNDLKSKGTTKITEEESQDVGEKPDEASVYRTGEFVDLCRGPHVKSTGKIGPFKLLSVAGAYWRGSEKNPMLTRIYGTAFAKQKELDEHLDMLEQAKERDHRKIGKELDLFSISEDVGPGLVHWHPKGARMRVIVEDIWRQRHFASGYDIVYTPHIGKADLWKTSGHLDFYAESMYSSMDIDGQDYYLKPMNCPFHIQIFKTSLRSYKDLPLRWAELGTVYRYEKSGVVQGLLRVRGFTQDDAHIICTPEQIEDEIMGVLKFSLDLLRTFGFNDVSAYLSTRPEKSVGDDKSWEQANNSLEQALKKEKIDYEVDEGGGAFYGPKIDLKIKDAIGREWQLTTIQFDFNLPERFDMVYVGEDGQEHRPYMVHRALLGSIERFFGILIEHYNGAFPLWLAPVQVRLISVGEGHVEFARELEAELKATGVRAEVDVSDDTVGNKIRKAAKEKIPWTIVLGDKEVSGEPFKVRVFGSDDELEIKRDDLVDRIKQEQK